MNEHTVKSYEEELALLDKKIAHMGGLAEHLMGESLDALERRDPKLAEEVVASAINTINMLLLSDAEIVIKNTDEYFTVLLDLGLQVSQL